MSKIKAGTFAKVATDTTEKVGGSFAKVAADAT